METTLDHLKPKLFERLSIAGSDVGASGVLEEVDAVLAKVRG